MTYVQDLLEGMHINQVFLVKQKQSGVSKTGKNYYSLKLRDKTGEVDAKIWSLNNAIEHFEVNDFVMVDGEVRSFNNAPQVSINRIRRAKEGEYDEAEYMPASAIPVDKMYAELMDLRSKVENPHLKRLLEAFFVEDQDFIRTFKAHSAAKSVHHNFLGGLLQHTLRVTQLCYFFCKQYPMLNKDLLLTAAMFHDIGKTRELSEFPDNDYTKNRE